MPQELFENIQEIVKFAGENQTAITLLYTALLATLLTRHIAVKGVESNNRKAKKAREAERAQKPAGPFGTYSILFEEFYSKYNRSIETENTGLALELREKFEKKAKEILAWGIKNKIISVSETTLEDAQIKLEEIRAKITMERNKNANILLRNQLILLIDVLEIYPDMASTLPVVATIEQAMVGTHQRSSRILSLVC